MDVTERRKAIMRILHREKHTTIVSLAASFGVSERTVRRDIVSLSLSEPIYTSAGRYGGGVHLMEGAEQPPLSVRKEHLDVIRRITQRTKNNLCLITDEEMRLLEEFLRENAG